MNIIGGYFSHGPQAGDFQFATFASLPQPRTARETAPEALARRARAQGLEPEDIGKIDCDVFLAFLWQLAGHPADVPPDWQRERLLASVVDHYSVHQGERGRAELPHLQVADVYPTYLPACSPEFSRTP